MDLKEKTAEKLANATALDVDKILSLLEVPPNPEMGDYAFPCFILAKELKKAPPIIAFELAQKISADFIDSVSAIGPYLNIKLKKDAFAQEIISSTIKFESTGKTIMIEFSQPNTHKEFHVGHLRNACLGDSLVRISKFVGNKVIAANYIGDIGTHVAKALWCLQKFHSKEKYPENKGKFLGSVYVDASKRLEENEDLKEEVSAILQKLEAREEEITALWEKTREWSLDEFKSIYKDLDINFDKYYFESEEDGPSKKIAYELLEKGIAKKSEGAVIVNLENQGAAIALVVKTDGTTLYLTKDLSLGQRKFKDYELDTSIYVIDSRQNLHIKQAFEILKLMGFEKDLIHIAYEFVSTINGPIASRKGNTYLYEDLKERMMTKLISETKKRHSEWEESKINDVAHKVSIGALKYGMLKMDNNKEIIFDENEWLDFEGETGPYIQYTYCRLNSLAKKAENADVEIDYSILSTNEDNVLLKLLDKEKDTIIESAKSYKPSTIARYVLELAQKTNEYYHKHQVLKSDEKTKNARLLLLDRIKKTIKRDLLLLGIECPEEM